jgi:hypothetical protein
MNIAKNIAKISALSGSLVIVASSTVSAGPMSIAGANIVTPPSQVAKSRLHCLAARSEQRLTSIQETGLAPKKSDAAKSRASSTMSCGTGTKVPGGAFA